jgi:hypothetical protein
VSREDQYDVRVSIIRNIGGVLVTKDLGTFDGMTGGEIDSEESKYRPGGMAAQISLGGYVNVGNVTVNRLYDLARDYPNVGWLINGVGRADMIVTKQSLDVEGNPFGKPLVYSGKLKTFTPPDHDSMSSDPAKFEFEMSSARVTIQQ